MRKILAVVIATLCAAHAVAQIQIEAESGRLHRATPVEADAGASQGKCVVLRGAKGRVNQANPAIPEATYVFQLETGATYSAIATLQAPSGGSNSFFVAMDGDSPKAMSVKPNKAWQDKALGSWVLEAGEHSLRFWAREPGLRIDRIVIGARLIPKSLIEKYPMPSLAPPPEHPRVLVRSKDIAAIRARRTQGENAEAWERVQHLAGLDSAKLLKGLRTISSASFKRDPVTATRSKAFMYLVDKDEAMGRDAVQLASGLLAKQKFDHGKGVTRPIGELIYSCAIVYDWCYPLMNDAQRKDFVAHFERLGSQMEIHYPPFSQGAITGHAGEAQLLRDILCAAIAVYDEYPAMYRMATGRFFAEFIEPRNFFYPSGRHHQGDAYGPYRYGWEIFSSWVFRRMAGVDVYDSTQVRVPYAWIYSRRPDGPLWRVGDSGRGNEYSRFDYPLILAANYYRDPVLKGELMRQGVRRTIRTEPILFLLVNDPALETKPLEDLPLTRHLGGPLPSMQIRTGWNLGMASQSVVADLWGAHTHFNNHDHLDAGHFQIYYRGALAHDPGVYGGGSYGCPYDWAYNKRTISHNAMLVYDPKEDFGTKGNDGGQRFPNGGSEPATFQIINTPEHRNGEVLNAAWGPNTDAPLYDYMQVDLDAAYSDKVAAYTRTFVFLNLDRPGNPAALIVLDRIRSAKAEFKKYWLIHTPEKPATGVQEIDIRRTDGPCGGRLHVTTLLPDKPVMDVMGGIGDKVDVFGKQYDLPLAKAEAPGWCVRMSPSQPRESDTFLNVLQVLDAEGADLLPVRNAETADCFIVGIADRVVILPKADGTLSGPISFTVETPSQMLATGLKPGNWELALKGKPATYHAPVSAEKSTAFFVLEPGEYILQPGNGGKPAPTHAELKPQPEKPKQASVIVGGRILTLGDKLNRSENIAQLPIKRIAEVAGAEVKIQGDTLTARKGGNELTMKAGAKSFRINNTEMTTLSPLEKRDSDIYGPPEALAQLLRMWYRDDDTLDEVAFYTPPREDRPSHWIVRSQVAGAKAISSSQLAYDGDVGSIWSCNAERVALEMNLGKPQPVSCVSVSWYHGNARKENFQIEVSDDGKQWRQVWKGASSGKNESYEDYRFDAVTTRHIRLVCLGNDKSNWNSIRELRIREK